MLDQGIRFDLKYVGFALKSVMSIVAELFACSSSPGTRALDVGDNTKIFTPSGLQLHALPST